MILQRLLILLSIFALPFIECNGQVFRHFTTQSGLNTNIIHEIFQDSRGYLWLATDVGVTRFDGNEFESFSTEHGYVDGQTIMIGEDLEGNVWFSTLINELCYYSYEEERFIVPNYLDDLKTLTASYIFRLNFYENDLYISCKSDDGSIIQVKNCRSDSAEIVLLKNPEPGIRIHMLEDSSMLFTFSNMSQADHLSFTGLVDTIIPFGLNRLTTFEAKRLSNGEILLLGIDELYLVSKSFELMTIEVDYFGVGQMYEDSKGRCWVGTFNDGVFVYANNDFSTRPTQYLSSFTVTGIVEDDEGSIWLSTLNNGLYYASSLQINPLVDDNLQIISSKAVKSSAGRLAWTNDFERISIGTFSPNEPISVSVYDFGIPVTSFEIAENLTLVKTRKRRVLSEIRNDRIRDLGLSNVGAFASTRRGYWYASTTPLEPFVYFYDTNHKRIHTVERIYFNRLRKIFNPTANRFYTQDNENRLVFYQKETAKKWSCEALEEEIRFIEPLDFITMLGHEYLVTRNSEYYLLEDAKIVERGKIFQGSDTTITKLVLDSLGTGLLYLLTNRGIYTVETLGDRPTLYLNQHLGLPSGELLDMTKSGAYFILSTSLGTYFWIDTLKFRDSKPAAVMFKRIAADDKEYDAGLPISLSAGFGRLEIELHAISFRNALEIPYRYKLGASGGWINANNRKVVLTSLEPGSYTLFAQAANANGTWSQSSSLDFEVLFPFYMRWWFIALSIGFGIGLTYLVYLNRLAAARRAIELQSRVFHSQSQAMAAQLSPHFVFNAMNSLASFVTKEDTKNSLRYLSKLAKLMRTVYEFSQQSSVPLVEEFEMVEDYLSLEQLRFEFDYEIRQECASETVEIPPLMLQPLIENAIKHAFTPGGENRILVRAHCDHSCIRLEVLNSGLPLKTTLEAEFRQGKRNSLSLIYSRIGILKTLMNMDIEFNLEPIEEEGYLTKASLAIPKNLHHVQSVHS